MTRQAAQIGVEFVDEPPERARRLRAVPSDYVAPRSHRQHGDRAKYVVEKCRCEPCRAAARQYELERRRRITRPDETWVPYVPATAARQHLRMLAEHGIGLKTVAKLSGLPGGTLSKIIYGDPARGMRPSRRIRARTEAKILAVTVDQADGAQRVPAAPTWRLLDDLIGRGFTRSWIARQLGSQGPGLQIARSNVRASTARAVEDLHARLEGIEPRQVDAHRHHRWELQP